MAPGKKYAVNVIISNPFKTRPWLPFMLLALVMQQANLLTYKFGGQASLPHVFLMYSFFFQAVLNLALMFGLRRYGFPFHLRNRMKLWAVWVTVVYLCNELLLMITFTAGAPYAVMVAVFLVTSLMLLTLFGMFWLREKLSMQQIGGIVLTVVAIIMIKLG